MIRAALLYFACWVPFGLCYSLILLLSGRPISVPDAFTGGMVNSLQAAILGIPVYLLTRRGLRGAWSRARLTSVSSVAVVLFAAAWTTMVSLSVIRFAPPEAAAMYMRWGVWWQFITGVLLGAAIVGICVFLHNAKRLREQEARIAQAEALRARAELAALRAQLQPHFLFNALHSISAVLRSDPRGAESALEQLGSMLRYALGVQRDDREEVALAEELDFVRAYLTIERLRLGDRLRVEEQIDPEALECAVLAVTLQPLVENAVRHGIAASHRGGTIRLAAHVESDRLELEIADDGIGSSADLESEPRGSRGVGIRSVRQRLDARYGASASLRLETAAGRGFRACISLPVSAPEVQRTRERPLQPSPS
ncbi:MAG: histidine kinase [Gemmatimonadota bacterium]